MKKLIIVICFLLGLSEFVFAAEEPSAGHFEKLCSQCHSLNRVLSKTKTKQGWKKTIDVMMRKMDSTLEMNKIDQNEQKQLVEYLYSKRGYKDSERVTAEERKEKLLEKYTSSKSSIVSEEEKKQKLAEKYTSSKTNAMTAADMRKQKFQEKYPPSEARTVSPRAKTVRPKAGDENMGTVTK